MNGESWGILTQTFTVPADGTLSLQYAYDNEAGLWVRNPSNPFEVQFGPINQWMEIDVISASAPTNTLNPSDILATLFDSQSGSPAASQNWTTATASLTAYAGQNVVLRVAIVNDDFFLPAWVTDVSVTSPATPPTNFAVTRTSYSMSASWNGTGAFTCTLMFGFNTPTSFSEPATGNSCTFGNLDGTTGYGIQVSSAAGSAVAFASPPTTTTTVKVAPKRTFIVCVKGNHRHRVTAVQPHCPVGYHRVS